MAVEELKHSPKSTYHQLGSEIYYTYIRAPCSAVKIDKSSRLKIESFLLGDVGPDIFYDIQTMVLRTLDDKYHSPFLASKQYADLKTILATEEMKDMLIGGGDDSSSPAPTVAAAATITTTTTSTTANGDFADGIDLANHSTYARTKLEQLAEKLENKNHALDAMKVSLKTDSKLLSILDKEVDWLRMEKRQLEAHLMRTEVWAEHLGNWSAVVQSVEVPDEKEPPQFMILVQIEEKSFGGAATGEPGRNGGGAVENENISTGWVVLRSLTEFHVCAALLPFFWPFTFHLRTPFFCRNCIENCDHYVRKYERSICHRQLLKYFSLKMIKPHWKRPKDKYKNILM